jgi:hypothetical protein
LQTWVASDCKKKIKCVIAKNYWFISVTAKGQKETKRVCDCKKVQCQIETVKKYMIATIVCKQLQKKQ